MRTIELKPSTDNLVQTFVNDSIGRTADLCSFVKMLQNIDGACSIGIDGKWGTGKTFFVKQSKLILDALNPNTPFYSTEHAEKMKDAFSRITKEPDEGVPVVTAYYDAWQHDDEKEPLLSLLYEILKDNYNSYSDENKRSWTDILSSIAGVLCDRDINTLVKELKGNDIFAKQRQNEELDALIEKLFCSFLPERGNKLVVFIDELDRCSPAFAVKLLERIKHYFVFENLIFVFSINFGELQNTVKNYYGDDFDACRYMDRFFDIRMEIPPIDMSKYVQSIERYGSKDLRQAVCEEVIRQMNMGMREASRFLQMSRICAYKYTDGQNYEKYKMNTRDYGISNLIVYFVIVPITMGLKITDTKQFDEFVQGKSHIWLERIILSESIGDWVTSFLLNNNEVYQKVEGKNQVSEKQKIKDVYDAIFVKTYEGSGEYQTIIGKALFEKGCKQKIMRTISMVSPFADYTV